MATKLERPRSTLRQRRSEELRRLIIDTTIAILAKDGVRQTTTVEVARQAGISESSIFWHFGDREGLFAAVALDLQGRVGFRDASIFSGPNAGARERLIALVDGAVQVARSEPEALLAANTLLNDTTVMERVRPQLAESIHDRRASLVKLLEDAHAAGVNLRVSPVAFIEFVSAAMLGIHSQLRHHHEGQDREPMFQALRIAGLALLGIDEA